MQKKTTPSNYSSMMYVLNEIVNYILELSIE